MTLFVLCFITWYSRSSNSSECSDRKRTFLNPNVEDSIPYRGKDFQTESIIGVIRDDVLLGNKTGWIYKVTVRPYCHGAEKNNSLLGIRSTLMIPEYY
jgi:hypothetical protein